jgi:hypothetical protein
MESGTNNLVGLFVGSTTGANEFIDVQLMEMANVTAGWYDIVLTAIDDPSTVFVRGLYLTT